MAELRVASRYVKALLALALEQGQLEAVHQDMLLFSKVAHESRDFVNMLQSPIIRHEKKRVILEKIFGGKVNKLTLAIIDIVTRKNLIRDAQANIKKYETQLNEVKNNREYDAISKEIEIQGLDIQVSEKKIKEFGYEITTKTQIYEKALADLEAFSQRQTGCRN